MDDRKQAVARRCMEGAESNTMSFPEIVGTLMQEGFESYAVDFRRAIATYYLSDGDSVALSMHKLDGRVPPTFDPLSIQAAITEAQQLVPGYSYKVFCEKIAAAGCAGYLVSFTGRRVLYFGRTAESHVEHFPD